MFVCWLIKNINSLRTNIWWMHGTISSAVAVWTKSNMSGRSWGILGFSWSRGRCLAASQSWRNTAASEFMATLMEHVFRPVSYLYISTILLLFYYIYIFFFHIFCSVFQIWTSGVWDSAASNDHTAKEEMCRCLRWGSIKLINLHSLAELSRCQPGGFVQR